MSSMAALSPRTASYQQTMAYDAEQRNVQKGGRGSSSGGTAAEELQTSHGWRDWVWALIFWLHLIALIAVGYTCYGKWKSEFAPEGSGSSSKGNTGGNLGPLEHAIPIIGFCLAFGASMSLVFLYLFKNHGVVMIWISLIFTLIMSGAVLVLAAFAGDIVGVVLAALLFAFTCWYVYSVRSRIPFAAAMLDVSLRAMSTFKSAYLIPIVGMILMGVLSYVWSMCAFSIAYAVDHGSNTSAQSVRGLIYFVLALSFFWTMLVIKGWVHTAIAGVQASWYFLYPHATPSSPVLGAVKRASTTSFGSICFGSFLVALIRTIRYFLNIAQQQARQSNNVAAACALCIVDCIIGCIENLINYINQYAFAICAIYGKSFIPAAQQAWSLMKSRGFDAVVNDSLIGGVLNLSILIVGLSTGILGALIAYYGYGLGYAAYAGIGFVIGMALMLVVAEVVESAVISLFICLGPSTQTCDMSQSPELVQLYVIPAQLFVQLPELTLSVFSLFRSSVSRSACVSLSFPRSLSLPPLGVLSR
jgi:hypothetical protein